MYTLTLPFTIPCTIPCTRTAEHTSDLQSPYETSYADVCMKNNYRTPSRTICCYPTDVEFLSATLQCKKVFFFSKITLKSHIFENHIFKNMQEICDFTLYIRRWTDILMLASTRAHLHYNTIIFLTIIDIYTNRKK